MVDLLPNDLSTLEDSLTSSTPPGPSALHNKPYSWDSFDLTLTESSPSPTTTTNYLQFDDFGSDGESTTAYSSCSSSLASSPTSSEGFNESSFLDLIRWSSADSNLNEGTPTTETSNSELPIVSEQCPPGWGTHSPVLSPLMHSQLLKALESKVVSHTNQPGAGNHQAQLQPKLKVMDRTKLDKVTTNKPECSICKRQYSSKKYLENHIKTLHSEQPPAGFNCFICGKTVSQSNRKKHELSHKTEDELIAAKTTFHKCPVCQKLFYDRTLYRRHCRTHVNVRTHPCPTCGKLFKEKSQLGAHQKVHEVRHDTDKSFWNTLISGFSNVPELLYYLDP